MADYADGSPAHVVASCLAEVEDALPTPSECRRDMASLMRWVPADSPARADLDSALGSAVASVRRWVETGAPGDLEAHEQWTIASDGPVRVLHCLIRACLWWHAGGSPNRLFRELENECAGARYEAGLAREDRARRERMGSVSGL